MIASPGLILVQRAFFRGRLFSEDLIIGENFELQNGYDMTIKTA